MRWQRRSGWWAVAIVASVVSGCSAAATTAPPGGPAPAGVPTRIHAVPAVVLGDSLSVQATEHLSAKIPGVVVDAVIGRTIATPNLTDAAMERVPELRTVDAAWFVVELGTNDATFAGYPDEQMSAEVAGLLDAIGRERCIAWVLPYVSDPRTPMQIADTERFRTIAATAVSALGCGRVLDWGDMVKKNPNLLSSDGVHLTELGMQRLADLVAFGVG